MNLEPMATAEAPPIAHTEVQLAYAGASRLEAAPDSAELELVAELHRDPVRLDGVLKEPLRFREAMATLYAVVGSDLPLRPEGPHRLPGLSPHEARVGRP